MQAIGVLFWRDYFVFVAGDDNYRHFYLMVSRHHRLEAVVQINLVLEKSLELFSSQPRGEDEFAVAVGHGLRVKRALQLNWSI